MKLVYSCIFAILFLGLHSDLKANESKREKETLETNQEKQATVFKRSDIRRKCQNLIKELRDKGFEVQNVFLSVYARSYVRLSEHEKIEEETGIDKRWYMKVAKVIENMSVLIKAIENATNQRKTNLVLKLKDNYLNTFGDLQKLFKKPIKAKRRI